MTSSGVGTARRYCYPGIDDPTTWTVSTIVRWQAENHPNRIAIDFIGGDSWHYRDCDQHALAVARWLRDNGMRSGSRVAVMTEQPDLFCACWLGLAELGAVMVAVNTGLRGEYGSARGISASSAGCGFS